MRACSFRQLASSALLPGNHLEGFLEWMLEKSICRAVARRGTPCSKRGPGRSLQLARSSRKAENLYWEEQP